MDDLLLLIDTFRAAHGMSESTFGRLAVKDAKLIPNMRQGKRNRHGVLVKRELRRATVAKITHFMAAYEPQREAA